MYTIHNQRGVTLVEMLVTIAIMSVLMLAITNIFNFQSKLYSGERKVTHMVSDTRVAIQRVTRLIRLAGYNPWEIDTDASTGPTFGIRGQSGTSVNTDTAFYYTADINGNKSVDNNSGEIVYLRWNSIDNRLETGDVDPATGNLSSWVPFVANITNFAVVYIYKDGTKSSGTNNLPSSAQDMRDVRVIQISLTAQTEEKHNLTKSNYTETVTSKIKLRNITGL